MKAPGSVIWDPNGSWNPQLKACPSCQCSISRVNLDDKEAVEKAAACDCRCHDGWKFLALGIQVKRDPVDA